MSAPLTSEERTEMAARIDRPRRGPNGDSARLLRELERVESEMSPRAREVADILAAAAGSGMTYNSERLEVLRLALGGSATAAELRVVLARIAGRCEGMTNDYHHGVTFDALAEIARGALGL